MKTKAILSVFSAFLLMLFFGSIYSWSLFVPFLKSEFGYSAFQTQLVFGTVIAVFSVTMIFVNDMIRKHGLRTVIILAGILYATGYLLAFYSQTNYLMVWLGIGLFGGISTGIGYLVSVSVPALWFPDKKGLITGIVSAGFGGGAILHSYIAETMIKHEFKLIEIISYPALVYAVLIIVLAFILKAPENYHSVKPEKLKILPLLKNLNFIRLFIGILTGTFAGLMVIGNLKPIGMQFLTDEFVLATGIGIFSIANLAGRLSWGWIADHVSAHILMPLTLIITGISVVLISFITLTPLLYYSLAVLVGFGFGAHLVLYARETAHRFGIDGLARVYPYVFLGYGLSGILGPVTGGLLSESTGNFHAAALVSMSLCFLVALAMIVERMIGFYHNKKK
ncbi:MAG: MFS transporter [Paludibacteraceae bacterium]|nr:MFS transporter [Paludibacteraceae bacterium]